MECACEEEKRRMIYVTLSNRKNKQKKTVVGAQNLEKYGSFTTYIGR